MAKRWKHYLNDLVHFIPVSEKIEKLLTKQIDLLFMLITEVKDIEEVDDADIKAS